MRTVVEVRRRRTAGGMLGVKPPCCGSVYSHSAAVVLARAGLGTAAVCPWPRGAKDAGDPESSGVGAAAGYFARDLARAGGGACESRSGLGASIPQRSECGAYA